MILAVLASMLAQTLLPAKPGVIWYREGEVSVDSGSLLRTQNGRAEVLIAPWIVLLLGERGALRTLTNSLTNSRVELVMGAAIVQLDGGDKRKGRVDVVVKGSAVHLSRDGIYRFDTDPPGLKVYDGVTSFQGSGALRSGHMLIFGSQPSKFDRKQPDPLQQWNDLRVRYLIDESGIGLTGPRPGICVP